MGKVVNEFVLQSKKVKLEGNVGKLVNLLFLQCKSVKPDGNEGELVNWLLSQFIIVKPDGKVGKLVIWLFLQVILVKPEGKAGNVTSELKLQFNNVKPVKPPMPVKSVIDLLLTFKDVKVVAAVVKLLEASIQVEQTDFIAAAKFASGMLMAGGVTISTFEVLSLTFAENTLA